MVFQNYRIKPLSSFSLGFFGWHASYESSQDAAHHSVYWYFRDTVPNVCPAIGRRGTLSPEPVERSLELYFRDRRESRIGTGIKTVHHPFQTIQDIQPSALLPRDTKDVLQNPRHPSLCCYLHIWYGPFLIVVAVGH